MVAFYFNTGVIAELRLGAHLLVVVAIDDFGRADAAINAAINNALTIRSVVSYISYVQAILYACFRRNITKREQIAGNTTGIVGL